MTEITIMNRDLRKYARQTNIQLSVGFVILLFLVGDGLIYLFLGKSAALMGLLCLVAGLSPIILILGALLIIDWVAKQHSKD